MQCAVQFELRVVLKLLTLFDTQITADPRYLPTSAPLLATPVAAHLIDALAGFFFVP